MTFPRLLLGLFLAFFSAVPSFAQFPPTASSADSAVISVQQLAMPRKAVRAFEKGSKLLVKGDPQSSLPYLQNATGLAPDNYAPYHNLAIAHYELGHLDQAGQNFQKAIDASKSSYAPSLFGLSMILYRRGEYAQAEALIRQGLSLTPNSAPGKYCLSLVQYSSGHFAEAQRNALDAIRLNPNLSDIHVLLAHIYQRLHDPNAVLAEVDSYLARAPHGNLEFDALDLRQRAHQELASAQLRPN
jgi:tetratricopeptide (TPR) repeat protein